MKTHAISNAAVIVTDDTRLRTAQENLTAATNDYARQCSRVAARLISRMWPLADLVVFDYASDGPYETTATLVSVEDRNGNVLWYSPGHPATDKVTKHLPGQLEPVTSETITRLLAEAALTVPGFFPTHESYGVLLYQLHITAALAV